MRQVNSAKRLTVAVLMTDARYVITQTIQLAELRESGHYPPDITPSYDCNDPTGWVDGLWVAQCCQV